MCWYTDRSHRPPAADAAAAFVCCLLQLVGQLENVEEEPSDAEEDTDDAAAAADAAPAATPAAAAAVSAAAIAAAAVAGCDSDSGGSSRSDGSAVPVRSMPVPITQRKVRTIVALSALRPRGCVWVVSCCNCAHAQRASAHHKAQGKSGVVFGSECGRMRARTEVGGGCAACRTPSASARL